MPAFHSGCEVTSKEGSGDYALYHGNMAVGENIEAATFLIENVFANTEHYLIIAGSNPPIELVKLAENHSNVEIRANISVEHLDQLIADAHVNVLPTFQPTGIKLKLLSALYKGRHCLVNDAMVSNTGLETTCIKANTPKEWKKQLKSIFTKPMDEETIQNRQSVLTAQFDNVENAKIILENLYSLKTS